MTLKVTLTLGITLPLGRYIMHEERLYPPHIHARQQPAWQCAQKSSSTS